MHKTVCVFCGADQKIADFYKQTAYSLGAALAKHNFALISGGNNVGLMKQVIDGHAHTNASAPRHSVIPEIFKEFDLHHDLVPSENIYWVENVHARMRKFYELSDNIVALPGGFGTLHELMDCLVHNQFGINKKRIFLLNINNFWDGIIKQFNIMVEQQTLRPEHLAHLVVVNSTQELIDQLLTETHPELTQGFADRHWE